MTEFDYDVAVVGVGAVGGVLVNLLGLQGVRTVAIDRSPQAVQLPRGVGIDGEIMRVAQTVGLAETLEPLMQPFPGSRYLDVHGDVVTSRPAHTGVGAQGWIERYQMHQPDFERVFREGIEQRPSVDVRYGHDVDEVRPGADGGGIVTMTDAATGERSTITARYIVGCDGASSTVRRAAGLKLDDFGVNEPWLVVDIEIDDEIELPATNTHYPDPERPVIYINVVRDQRRYEFRAAPGEDLSDALEPKSVWKRLSRFVSPEHATLVRAAVYTHRSLVAQHWRDGALIVAGDAAHQTPPFMGQGLCAGVRDASSLAWRLAAIIQDGAADSLVDSYESERDEHARFIIKAATALGQVYKAPDKEKLESINASVGREGRGQTPRLGHGIWVEGGPGGTLAPQPRLADGRLVDDAIGYRFGVVATSAVLGALPDQTQQLAKAAGFGLVEATGEASGWLAELGADAVILRPDRYYYGTFHDVTDIEAAIRDIADIVAPYAI